MNVRGRPVLEVGSQKGYVLEGDPTLKPEKQDMPVGGARIDQHRALV